MPYNPQAKPQSNLCAEILAKFIKQQDPESLEQDSVAQNQNNQIAEGKWQDDQNLKFGVFIDFHSKIFSSKQRRKSQKIFKILSNFLGNRTPAQCRSHYQKVMIKFKTLAKLKKHFKQYFGEQIYTKNFKELAESHKQMHVDQNQEKSESEIKLIEEKGVQTQLFGQSQQNLLQMIMSWQMQQWMNPFFSPSQVLWQQNDRSYQ